MIEIKDNGEIDSKKLTTSELDCMVDMRLDYYKRELDSLGEQDE
jgi:hypothetical protein